MVDTEPGVINSVFNSNLGKIFDEEDQSVFEKSGAGNNWAHGNYEYGPKMIDTILEKLRREVEETDSL